MVAGEGAVFGDVSRLSTHVSRSISAENPTGEPGGGARATEGSGARAARDLGPGWKVSPSRVVEAGETLTLADIDGPGVIRHMWLTCSRDAWRRLVLRVYWDGAQRPAVAVPLGDFFGLAWGKFAPLHSQFVTVAPNGGLNSYWPMPFRHRGRVELENLGDQPAVVYYQVDYSLGEVSDDAGYFHARWRRSYLVRPQDVHTLVEGIEGSGQYVGTFLAVGVTSPGWWGEGEIKFYLDGEEYPTICGTGTEDYFGGAWNFDVPGQGYTTYTSPYLGLHQVLSPDGLYQSQQRFGMYRWHGPDPIRFSSALRVTIQDLGWMPDGRYLSRQDDLASVAYWYLDGPQGCDDAPLCLDELLTASRP